MNTEIQSLKKLLVSHCEALPLATNDAEFKACWKNIWEVANILLNKNETVCIPDPRIDNPFKTRTIEVETNPVL